MEVIYLYINKTWYFNYELFFGFKEVDWCGKNFINSFKKLKSNPVYLIM